MFRAAIVSILAFAAVVLASADSIYRPSNVQAPPPPREFRGVWVASFANIDWPSQRGLPPERQKQELLAILDRAVQLKLNAVILQVRPACDALYASGIEPWSEYLTGQMGQAPKPFYDPLTFAVQEAHKRGLELHAWFNPFRVRHSNSRTAASPDHVSRTRPELVRTYGKQLWLDPGEKVVQDYSINVILDVVKRYDIDGVHLDDYFYPYPVKDEAGRTVDFPDSANWSRYAAAGGKLGKADWRRSNVDGFIQRLCEAIKAEKAWVKFGISPFGIWRSGYPAQIRGFDSYASLYADSRRWLEQGWLDYFAPQLYWPTAVKQQSYPVLLKWWTEQNSKHRHLWPGNSDSNGAAEIVNQVRLTRQQPGATGNIHWGARALMQNRGGVADGLRREVYTNLALIPASTWLDSMPPSQPRLTVTNGASATIRLTWEPMGAEPVALWLLQTRSAGEWTMEVVLGGQTSRSLNYKTRPDVIALSAIDRCGNASPPAVVEWHAANGE